MKNLLLKFLMRNTGAYINLDNCVFRNDGKKLTIEIPLKSFEKYSGNILNGDEKMLILDEGGFKIIGK